MLPHVQRFVILVLVANFSQAQVANSIQFLNRRSSVFQQYEKPGFFKLPSHPKSCTCTIHMHMFAKYSHLIVTHARIIFDNNNRFFVDLLELSFQLYTSANNKFLRKMFYKYSVRSWVHEGVKIRLCLRPIYAAVPIHNPASLAVNNDSH